jgi:hypothetical protein
VLAGETRYSVSPSYTTLAGENTTPPERCRSPALFVGASSVWRLGGTCGTWANKAPPAKPLSCKALRHVWRLRHLFFTFWGRTKSRKKILRTAHRYFLVEDRALTTRHTCHTCLKPVWRKGFRVRRLCGTCSTQAPPCTQSATLPVSPVLKPVKLQKK